MRVYQVRDEHGVLKAIINENNGRSVFQNLNGQWSTTTSGKRMFTLTDDGKVAGPMFSITLYFWAGDNLIESFVDC